MMRIIINKLIDFLYKFKIWRWKKEYHLTHRLNILRKISADIDGFQLSKQARNNQDALEYVYGEIDPTSFAALLTLVPINQNTVFYDLGSGIGHTIILSAMLFDLKKSCGIEILGPLHQAALIQTKRLSHLSLYKKLSSKIVCVQGNFLDIDFHDATLIYMNATAYFGDLWIALNQKLEALPHCICIITTSKPLLTKAYTLHRTTHIQMNFGIVKAYIHHRR